MKIFISIALIFCMFVMIGGCASITTGTHQNIPIDSSPQGAGVIVSSGYEGVTPCSFNLKRNIEHVIVIAKEGYKTAQIQLKRNVCGSTAGNLVFGGIIGLGVDAMTGACFKLIPEKVYVELIPGSEKDVTVIKAPMTQKEITHEKKKEEEKIAAEQRKPITTKDDTPITAKDGLPVTTTNKIQKIEVVELSEYEKSEKPAKNNIVLVETDNLKDSNIPQSKAIALDMPNTEAIVSNAPSAKAIVQDAPKEPDKEIRKIENFESKVSVEAVVEKAKEEFSKAGNRVTDLKTSVNRNGNRWEVRFSSRSSTIAAKISRVILEETTEGSLNYVEIKTE